MTIKDLARLSGYSLGTVSRVLNNQPNASEKARKRILEIAEAQGFELNTNAKNLKQQRTDSILVVVKGTANELFAQLLEKIQTLIAENGLPLIVDYIDENENEVRRASQLCREKKPQGILFLGGSMRNFEHDFERVNVPAVLVTNTAAGTSFPNLSSVTTDDMGGAEHAISYLMSLGHRQIAVIGGDPEISDTSRIRGEGCARAFRENGCSGDFPYEVSRYSYEDGYAAMGRILKKYRDSVTAVFAMSDVMAIGAIRCIRDWGLRVPEDISMVGYDGLNVGKFYNPKLTTVVQPADQMAERALSILRDTIKGAAPQHLVLPFTLAAYESAGER